MKKIICILACVLMAALLSSCDIGILDGPGMEYQYTDEDTDKADDGETENICRQIGDYVSCEMTETDFGIIEIPQFYNLMPQSDSTKEANEAFAQIRNMLLDEIEDYKAEGGTPPDGIDYSGNVLCSYYAGFCGDVVSVMLEYEDFHVPGYVYVSYNLNIENGSSPVDAANVMEICGVSEDTLKNSIRYYGEKAMTQEWEEQMLWAFARDWAPIDDMGDTSPDFADKLDDMVAMSLKNPLVYGDTEQLYIVVYYPTEAGSGCYCKLIAVSDDTDVIDSLSPQNPLGEEFKSAISDTEATDIVQHYMESLADKPAGLQFETEFLMPLEVEPDSYEPCYEIHAYYDEGDHITTAGRYAVSCYSAKLFEYDPVGDTYSPCSD